MIKLGNTDKSAVCRNAEFFVVNSTIVLRLAPIRGIPDLIIRILLYAEHPSGSTFPLAVANRRLSDEIKYLAFIAFNRRINTGKIKLRLFCCHRLFRKLCRCFCRGAADIVINPSSDAMNRESELISARIIVCLLYLDTGWLLLKWAFFQIAANFSPLTLADTIVL